LCFEFVSKFVLRISFRPMHTMKRPSAAIATPPGHDDDYLIHPSDHAYRSELFGREHLMTYAVDLASSLRVDPDVTDDPRFRSRFKENAAFLREANKSLAESIRAGAPLTPDAQWLLDNFYVVEEQLRQIQEDLPASYFRELPKLESGEPRIHRLALELISHTDSVLDQEMIGDFIRKFQAVTPLSIGEVWAAPIMLRLVLVENLRRLSSQMIKMKRCRALASNLADHWTGGDLLPGPLEKDRRNPQLILHMLGVIRECAPEQVVRLSSLEQLLQQRFPATHELLREEHQRQAANQVSIGNVITSMRLISAMDWVAFFEETNLAERILRRDPAGVYPLMDFESRDRYRHVIEKLAKGCRRTDAEIAELVVSRAASSSSSADTEPRSHVGYWLIDDGREAFEETLNYQPPLSDRMTRSLKKNPAATYVGSVATITLLGVVLTWFLTHRVTGTNGVPMLMALASILPWSEFAVLATNFLLTHVLKPRTLAKLELKNGVPDKYRTIVVVPSMLTGRNEVDNLLRRLEMHFIANGDPNLSFALLTDFSDAQTETTPKDAPLIAQATEGIEELNSRYGADGRGPFYLFHRSRKWNANENAWMGYERKRGKLTEFNALLRGARDTSYTTQVGDLTRLLSSDGKDRRNSQLDDVADAASIRADAGSVGHDSASYAGPKSGIQFVITLDADTQLPFGTARKLIGTLAHVLNRPQLNPTGTQVAHGYTLLQPRVSVHLADGNRSQYARIFANGKGLDPYATAASDVYQDLFGEGSFTGKGIYDVEAFETVLHDAFPENHILSHDLIEGCHVRVGLTTDIEVIDGFPSRYDADARRQHRWVRGDWQIAQWLFKEVPTATGSRPNRLSLLSRWKIFDNLRRSLVAPLLMVFMILGWSLAPQAGWWFTLAGLLCVGFPTVGTVVSSTWGVLCSRERRSQLRASAQDIGRSLLQTFIMASLLPHKAAQMVDAIARTLYRLRVSHKPMLEWETAAAVDQRLGQSRRSVMLTLWYLPALAVILAFALPMPAKIAAAFWLVAWLCGPFVAHIISRAIIPPAADYSEDQKQWLRLLARRTWNWFETMVTPRTNWLPPDNFQEYPQAKLAERISPTNEGLYLVSALVARDFGFLGLHSLIRTWERNLQSWEQLPKFHGHFYNWYDTSNMQALRPRYVSTVDSGNLAACFLVLKSAASDLSESPVVGPAQWTGLTDSLLLLESSLDSLRKDGGKGIDTVLDGFDQAVEEFQAKLKTRPASPREWSATLRGLQHYRQWIQTALQQLLPRTQFPADEVEGAVKAVLQSLDDVEEDVNHLLPWSEFVPPPKTETHSNVISDPVEQAWTTVREVLDGAITPKNLVALPRTVEAALSGLENSIRQHVIGDQQSIALRVFESLKTGIAFGADHASTLIARYSAFGDRAEGLALGMDFRFLYNTQRRLFAIGYNLEDDRLDRSHYDMLCSEARLTSFLAIAKGDVPARHWFQLGRQATTTANQFGLLSWGGTMFEYLMPVLFQRRYEGSLISQACRAAVARQKEYGRQLGIPWGVSESAYGALATNLDYQYQSFGVPGLGLKRGLSEDLVVAPYATMLSLPIAPQTAYANLRKLEQEGGLGRWGFYDAIEFTPERVPVGKRSVPVRCYMAHHQGMGLTAIGNVLLKDIIERRFHEHPLIRASELLLQEKVPAAAPVVLPHADETAEVKIESIPNEMVCRRMSGWQSPTPRTHLLSNGSYSVMVTDTGGGYSLLRDLAVTRFRPDPSREQSGQFIYLRDVDNNRVWSAAYQPTCVAPDAYDVTYAIDKAEFRRSDGEIETNYEVTVCPENQVEVRQLRIMNHGSEPRTIEVTSYAEIVLASQMADLAHPAFQKLFVETEYVPSETALLARRRPRDAQQPAQWAVHVLCCEDSDTSRVEFESNRQKFLGRGRTVRGPAALDPGAKLTGTAGIVLDPVFSLRCQVTVPAEGHVVVAFTTGTAASREEAMRIADQFHDYRGVQRAFELSWAYNQVNLHHLQLSAAQAQKFQRMAAGLIFPEPAFRGSLQAIRQNRQGQSGLWRFGISGDRTMLLLKVSEPDQFDFVREVAQGRRYWESLGLHVDLVILNELPGSYFDELQEQIQRLAGESSRPGGGASVFPIRTAQITNEDRNLLEAAASVVLDARRGWANFTGPRPGSRTLPPPKITHIAGASKGGLASDDLSSSGVFAAPAKPTAMIPASESLPRESLEFWNGLGGFADAGREYRILLDGPATTPMPWSNVIANSRFGCLITDSGAGYTWRENSRENKLTSWSNDPVVDPQAEMMFLRDEKTGDVWPALPGPRSRRRAIEVRHGQGYSRFLQTQQEIEHELLVSIAPDSPVKFICLKLRNRSQTTRDLSATYYADWVLGVAREQTRLFLVSDVDPETGALLTRNSYHPDFPDQVAFLQVLAMNRSLTADRSEFWGRNAHPHRPAALMRSGELGRKVGPGFDPCGAMQTRIYLAPGAETEVIFLLGCGADAAEARSLLHRYNTTTAVHAAIQQTIDQWNNVLSTIEVKTPNRGFDLLVNRWLVYQTLSCRIWGRSAFYQSGGAYGFRDQLQDVMATVYSRPDITREQILRAAARQYVEGDVQHWWHPPGGKGTRTRFSDDLLWLPFVVAHYIEVTGDAAILDEVVPYIQSTLLRPEEQERYEQPNQSHEEGTLYEHCLKTLQRGFRIGEHGLPLIGCGDWNDGMNKIGEHGRGESVWVGWFLLVLIDRFAPIMDQRGDDDVATEYRVKADVLRNSLEQNAWDGEWYRRAYFDDGTPLGSRENDECQIDSLAQTWAVMAQADPDRTEQGLTAVMDRLVSWQDRLVTLFTPPFDKSSLDPGYIKGYVPGVRENGGQYTHAVLWLIQALTLKGDGDQAMKIFDLINPVRHADNPQGVQTYQVEPYVIAADVYSVAPHTGRGGWTWYTGSASWAYRVALESILGFELRNNVLHLRPCVPADWDQFEITFRKGKTTWRLTVSLSTEEPDDAPAGASVELIDDGREHRITIHVPRTPPARQTSPLPPEGSRAALAPDAAGT
jgi:cyclic beta-1,2-glucan synthetase